MDDSPFCCLLCRWPLLSYDPCDLPRSSDHCRSDHRWTPIRSPCSLLCSLLCCCLSIYINPVVRSLPCPWSGPRPFFTPFLHADTFMQVYYPEHQPSPPVAICGPAAADTPMWAATRNAILTTPRHHRFRAVLRAGADVGADQITYISAFWDTRYFNDVLFHAIFCFAADVNCDHPRLQPVAVTQHVNSTRHAIPEQQHPTLPPRLYEWAAGAQMDAARLTYLCPFSLTPSLN